MGKITIKKFEKAVKGTDGIISHIAKKCGVAWITIREFIDENPEAQRLFDEEREIILDVAESKLFQRVKTGKTWAVQMALSTRGKARGYTEKKQIEHSGDVNVAMVKFIGDENGDGSSS